ncbi:MAG TPA: hypothetical protein PKJ65_02485 [Clostridia bacterium]|nr:MAG: hypothetical protein BWX78_00756 [Firmicutes bacterium ADurb.Bin099]HNZ40736.1 hypothetical protein [Clostridia bacterium]HPY98150.1 hypothetical protein [Clostridia bacterium]HQC68091.1 hypothetical protein [Clostridia bacterium]
MRQIILSMKDYIFADAVAQALLNEKGSDFAVQKTKSPEEIQKYCKITSPYALLMEVTGYPPFALSERLALREQVKKQNPNCKIVILVDENSEKEIAAQVRQAKKDGLIDQFIYGSTSASYLVAMMDTL